MSDPQKSKFIKSWKATNKAILSSMHPEISDSKIDKFLTRVVDKHLRVRTGEIYNSYNKKRQPCNLLQVVDWYHKKKPIVAGFGCLFKNIEEEPNPAAMMQDNFLNLRKKYKNTMYTFKEYEYEYGRYNMLQANEKVAVNSWYGCSGAPISTFFNLFTASSTTSTGQILTSTSTWAFEGFVGNNFKFIDLDECMFFMQNIKNEKRKLRLDFTRHITRVKLLKRLENHFYDFKDSYAIPLRAYVSTLTQEDVDRIYYKNNLMEFSIHPHIRSLLTQIFRKTKVFKDPSKIPPESREELDELWEYYKEYVMYANFWFGRIKRLKEDRRNCVPTIDTDSDFVNLGPWNEFVTRFIIEPDHKLVKRDKDALRFIAINSMSYMLSNMINLMMKKHCKQANVLKKDRGRINMKNEFLFTRMILASVKKRYITSMRLKEGHEIYPEKVKITGFDFMKSSTREETKNFFTELCRDEIMYVDRIDISRILRRLEMFEKMVSDSLIKREKNFLTPASVKELEAYKDPYKEMGVRSIVAWNVIYPDQTIELPMKVDIIKVKMTTLEDIEPLKETESEIYERIHKGIFQSRETKISKKGIAVIALPRSVKDIPEWLVPYIDYDTIINNNVSKFHGVLESLGIHIISSSKESLFSNVINI